VKQETRVVVERVNVRRGWLFRESEPGKVQNEDLELGSKLAGKGEKVDAARWEAVDADERGRARGPTRGCAGARSSRRRNGQPVFGPTPHGAALGGGRVTEKEDRQFISARSIGLADAITVSDKEKFR